jgi:hypothetical protein
MDFAGGDETKRLAGAIPAGLFVSAAGLRP